MGRSNVAETRVLVAEDEPVSLRVCSKIVQSAGYAVVEARSCAEAEQQCEATRPHAAILDYQLGDGDALSLMAQLREIDAALPILILTAHGSIELAVEAMRQGADHFLTKPVQPDALTVVLERCLREGRNRRRRRAQDSDPNRKQPDPFAAESEVMRKLARVARKIAASEGAVLLLGETGSGKGVIARWLHDNGPRAGEPFVELNCAGLKPEFLESELFGYKKGAFTGASEAKQGLLEIADRGTLFLDELGDMDLGIQAKLLKVLEEQTFRRLGGVRDRRVDVRLVAATHRDLAKMVRAEEFRADLYFRIHTLRLTIPPLRKRRQDISHIVDQTLASLSRKLGQAIPEITPDAMSHLTRYSWPGNIRELRNVIERAMILSSNEGLDVEDFLFEDSFGKGTGPIPRYVPPVEEDSAKAATPEPESETVEESLAEAPADDPWRNLRDELRRQVRRASPEHPLGRWLEEDLLLAANEAADGVQRRAAALLGMSKSTYSRRLRQAQEEKQWRSPVWQPMPELLEALLRQPSTTSELLAKTRGLLMQEIQQQQLKSSSLGAQLMGVSLPTFRKWLKEEASKS